VLSEQDDVTGAPDGASVRFASSRARAVSSTARPTAKYPMTGYGIAIACAEEKTLGPPSLDHG
jgi:hypothetical protein